MKRWMMVWLFLFACAQAQVKWDGGANTLNWNDGLNWSNDQVPGPADAVVLDNSVVTGTYEVMLPAGTIGVQVLSIQIQPSSDNRIGLLLPPANTAAPALSLQSAHDALDIRPGGYFINASGASSGTPISLTGRIRIWSGARYIHRTARPNAGLIDRLSTAPGTEKGIWEFDVPGTAGYTVSLTGNTFGSLWFSATAGGGAKSYSGSGSTALTIRGDLQIAAGAQVTSTLTADILVAGDLQVDGRLQLNPVTAGTAGRSLVFNGNSIFSGNGTLSMNAFFRNILLAPTARLSLRKPVSLSLTPHSFICQGYLSLGTQFIEGAGSFLLEAGATLALGHAEGLLLSTNSGGIRTSFRALSNAAGYVFNGLQPQFTGDGCPDSLAWLEVNNPAGLLLSKNHTLRDSLVLNRGIIGNTPGPAATLTLLPTAGIRSAPNTLGEVNTGWDSSFVSAPMTVTLADTAWQTLPTGDESSYMPIRLKAMVPDTVSLQCQYLPPPLPGNLSQAPFQAFVSGYWKISGFPHPIRLALPYRMKDRPETPASLCLGVLGEAASQWMPISTSGYSNSTAGWLVTDTALPVNTAAANNGIYLARAVMLNTLLPLELLHFDARLQGERIQLHWTAEEDGSPTRYQVERSQDGIQFKTIGYITSDARSLREHRFIDEKPIHGSNYYRLFILSPHKTLYSKVVNVNWEDDKPVLYPNPARDWINVRLPWLSRNFSGQSSRTELSIVNNAGAVVRRMFVNTSTCQIRVIDLPSGLYLVRLIRPERSFTLFFTKY